MAFGFGNTAKAFEQSYMVLKDEYSELARALGFQRNAMFDDPLECHAEVLAKVVQLTQELAASNAWVDALTDCNVDPVRLLKDACAAAGGQAAWAKAHGFSPAYVNDVLQARREPADNICTALGCRRVVRFLKGAAA